MVLVGAVSGQLGCSPSGRIAQGTIELVVERVLGLLDAIAMTVLGYWFGTSSSSALKTEMMMVKS